MFENTSRSDGFDPAAWMRSRRPELFPDSQPENEEPPMDRLALEFLLDQVTARKQEMQFEHFCRRLAEHELCPNLTVQTGPVGGGDRQVDAETYPVDEAIADRWYEGTARSATERWAFAFSAKRDWRPKVRSDVEKIANTQRGYSVVYFLTNQPVRDRSAAEVEDQLRQRHGIDVRILDRSWIAEKVISNRRWNVVYQTLGLERPATPSSTRPGPLDTQRTQELAEVDALIDASDRYTGSDYQLAEDCLQSALLARGLGRSRVEIDGRFDRAERIAGRVGLPTQVARVLYNRAWTAFWWFNDLAQLDEYYDRIQPLLIDSDSVWSLDELVNLWQLGFASSVASAARSAEWDERTRVLQQALQGHAAAIDRPAASLWARTELCFMNLSISARSQVPAAPVLAELKQIVASANGLLDYPVDTVGRMIEELGPAFVDDPVFDELFEATASLQALRVGKAQEGRSRLARGRQKLRADDPIAAVSQLGKAIVLLAQEEDKQDFFAAVAMAAVAYQASGLLWAARSHLIFALDRCLFEHQLSGSIAPQAVPVLQQLAIVELELGRVPCVLLWIDMLNVVAAVVPIRNQEAFESQFLTVDAEIGILLLRTAQREWEQLDRLAGYLDRLQLGISRGAALFAMGHVDQYRQESGQADEDLDEFFSLLAHQPAADQLPSVSEWFLGETVVMQTKLLGCVVRVEADPASRTVAWGETVLAFLETFFSTTLKVDGVWSMRPRLDIRLREDNRQTTPLSCTRVEDDCGEVHLELLHSDVSLSEARRTAGFDDAFIQLLAMAMAELHLSGSGAWLEEFFAKERAQDRAGFASSTILSISNVLGDQPNYDVRLQIPDEVEERLSLVRTARWVPGDYYPSSATSGEPDSDNHRNPWDGPQRHDDIEIVSMINLPAWDAARWRGVFFATPLDVPQTPVIALMFEDGDAGRRILRGWQRELGDNDAHELLSVTIVTGVDCEHPFYYRMAISTNWQAHMESMAAGTTVIAATRSLEMTPDSPDNLNRFLASYEHAGCYEVGAATFTADGPVLFDDVLLLKRELRIVSAWEVGRHDPVGVALKGVTSPVIPEGVKDPPIAGLLPFLSEDSGRP